MNIRLRNTASLFLLITLLLTNYSQAIELKEAYKKSLIHSSEIINAKLNKEISQEQENQTQRSLLPELSIKNTMNKN